MNHYRFLAVAVTAALLAGCAHPPPPPAPYHAVSDEGWHLIIDDRHVTFIGAGGQVPILQPRPQVINGIAGEIYQTPRINVNIVHAACTAGGRSYPDKVQVRVDGVAREGCGGH
ncbi:MAG TPA: hypothetical protein VD768_02890 [Sphingomicrobium sp.]|nr:hypothetical protein [Sphingomicrobium sp.]